MIYNVSLYCFTVSLLGKYISMNKIRIIYYITSALGNQHLRCQPQIADDVIIV